MIGYGNGTLQIGITLKQAMTGPLYLALYDDQGSNFTDVYHHTMSCADRLARIRGNPIAFTNPSTNGTITHEVIFSVCLFVADDLWDVIGLILRLRIINALISGTSLLLPVARRLMLIMI